MEASPLSRASPKKRAELHLALHGRFLPLLAGLDLERMRNRRASPSECVYMENGSPPR